MKWRLLLGLLTGLVLGVAGAPSGCERSRQGLSGPKSKHTSRFRIEIHGSPINYVPGEKYTVVLKGSPQGVGPAPKFTGFILTVEPLVEAAAGGGGGGGGSGGVGAGSLSLLGAAASRYHNEACPNMITHANHAPKSEVEAYWEAPQHSPGPIPHCVVFRATVIESGSLWYEDDGLLTKVFCQQQLDTETGQGVDSSAPNGQSEMQCCACDEAKYEVTFEGLWSRHTHPKDFPSNASLVPRFSDVIGASHTTSYRFWEYGGIASEGLKQLAETGSTRMLESELKSQSQNIRTIIIAKGISYPNVTGQTYAVFRVDSRHHKISLVSMIEPSPDWIVGVSGLELCLSNCSWTESRIVNLYPWDAGTDSGITYTSPDKPTEPRDHIRRITTSFPNDPQAPFFDPTGEEMKPLARLYLTRQRLYEKSCSDVNLEFNNNEACEVEEWGMWGPCSVSCGAGKRSRQRFFKNEQRALLNGCKRALTSRETCYASFACRPGQPTVDASLVDPQGDDTCATTEWSDWSGCSVKCGKGEKHRFRSMKHKRNWKECRRLDRFTKMQDSFECIGVEGPVCPEEGSAAALSVKCEYTNWSEWSPCSVTCGNGTRTRQRRVLFTKPNSYQQPQADVQSELAICQAEDRLVEHTDCQAELPSCQLTTQQAIDKTASHSLFGGIESDSFVRPYPPGDVYTVGGGPDGPVINCQVSRWSPWTECTATCGKGTVQRTRHIIVHAKNGGKDCPRKLMQRKSCRKPACNGEADSNTGDSNRDDSTYYEVIYDETPSYRDSERDASGKTRRWSGARRVRRLQ